MFGGCLGWVWGLLVAALGTSIRIGNPCSVALEEGLPTCLHVVGDGLSGQFCLLLWKKHFSVFSLQLAVPSYYPA